MYQKEISTHKSNLADLTILALSIQESGIAEVFVDFSGHVGNWSVRLFAPEWSIEKESAYSAIGSLEHTPEKLTEAVVILKDILLDGIEGWQRRSKIAKFEALKAELGEEAAL